LCFIAVNPAKHRREIERFEHKEQDDTIAAVERSMIARL
jgi:hypothetical protein